MPGISFWWKFFSVKAFYRDEISSRDELIPVKKTGMKFHSGMKKRKKDV